MIVAIWLEYHLASRENTRFVTWAPKFQRSLSACSITLRIARPPGSRQHVPAQLASDLFLRRRRLAGLLCTAFHVRANGLFGGMRDIGHDAPPGMWSGASANFKSPCMPTRVSKVCSCRLGVCFDTGNLLIKVFEMGMQSFQYAYQRFAHAVQCGQRLLSFVFYVTKRIEGGLAASQMASVPTKSFLLLLNRGEMSLASCPRPIIVAPCSERRRRLPSQSCKDGNWPGGSVSRLP
ncbi:hypothetical protein DUGA2_57250 [Duganella sp. HH101]|nr:hypothetical protein DUGA2_57250 [Duganella sp. HH101]